MLKSLRLEGFKSFADARVELGPTTLLIGANASGKSNFLDALRFLQGLARGYSLEVVLGGDERWPGIRGGAKEVGFQGATRFRLTSEWVIGEETLEYAVECDVSGAPVMVEERLVQNVPNSDSEVLFTASRGGDKDRSYFTWYQSSTSGESLVAVDKRSVHAGIGHDILAYSPELDHLHSRTLSLQAMLRDLVLLDPHPAAMRHYVPTRNRELGDQAENLSAILYRDTRGSDEKRAALVDWLAELCGEELRDITFSVTDLDDVMLAAINASGARTSARALSDGTLRFLALVTALRGAEKGKLLLLEEPERGLHPARLNLLAELFEGRAREEGAQLIATTHSPSLLAALPRETLGDAVVFAPASEGAGEGDGNIARRLRDLPHFEEVVERRGIEHLFTTRWIERAL